MLRAALDQLVALVAPPRCPACLGAGEGLCPACRAGLVWLRGERCLRCGLPAPCGRCPAAGAEYEAAWSPVAYEGTARALVAALKFRGRFGVADVMAAQIAASVPEELLPGAVLVPVPLHPARRRERGFNQAELIARALGRRSGYPLRQVLRRVGSSSRQVGAGRSQRLHLGRVRIEVAGSVPVVVALVDDVHTTGATLDACARTLRAAGAARVVAITYARTLP